jgi:hypothetical protein
MARRLTDNSDVELKVRVREWVAARLEELAVLDLFCGREGEMYQRVWHRAGLYLGVDKAEPHKLARTICLPAELAVQELDLDLFNCYDVDCYASPWLVARRVLRKRGPGRFGLVLTSGENRSLKTGDCNEVMRTTLGVSGLSDLRLLSRFSDLVMDLMIASLGEMPGIKLESGIKAKVAKPDAVYYFGLIVDKAG